MLQRLPVGIQTFAKLREGDFLYVDKTEHIHHLLDKAGYYFLSRPRRFGKSLLLSTIKEIYQGNRALFQGLWIENHWDWGKVHPVILLSINKLDYQGLGLEMALQQAMHTCAAEHQLQLEGTTAKSLFAELLEKLAKQQVYVGLAHIRL